jgi:ATP phosphoribosyltransferase regulatory subunit
LTAELDAVSRQALLSLCQLNGGIEVLDDALLKLPSYPDITKAIADLRQVALALSAFDISIGFDLAELRGYHYHSGMLFAAYAQGFSGPLALGGRYDEVGLAFGRSRPATGFSLDMRGLLTSLPAQSSEHGILAPYNTDVNLQLTIEQLRAAGEVVVVDLPGHEAYQAELHCNRKLIQQGEVWNVVPMH